ncbi:hypothetical protein [Pedobacter helvus]|uniref:Uncharacterized protein n=1 Tax=Pedobacter helvus TaxID=2563444 RepID=A0ABW9JN71_9SPHI|nr:hypothetical protein [Pedobacter ureilyticus]
MEDIHSPNFQALFNFTRQIKNDLAINNRQITMANVRITYILGDRTEIIETQIYISLNNHPSAKLTMIERGWLKAETYYTEFQTGYNKFSFNSDAKTLVIENNKQSKMGSYYRVEIVEI